jgi:hypothetical protein
VYDFTREICGLNVTNVPPQALILCVTSLSAIHVLLAILGVWRITHFFWGEDGPGDLVVRLRRLAGDGFFGRAMDCFYCLSIWVAAPFAIEIGGTWPERTLVWLGLSGGAILLERLTTQEGKKDDVVLR